ncbi:hypothetical protein ACWEV9_33375 [Streptomyces albogriseolus]|uniref:hypothetical protein n=1 Tax=Streptomyces albogriseolus TaxID=1887 RepID=UPI003F4D5698
MLREESGRSCLGFFAGAGVLGYGHNPPELKAALLEYWSGDGATHGLDMNTTARRVLLERDAERVVVGACGQHGHGDDQAEDIDRQSALATRHLLGRILPGRGRGQVHRRVDALGVHHYQTRVLRPPGLFAYLPTQQVIDLHVHAVVTPGRVVVVL